jgi:hypothetical protein
MRKSRKILSFIIITAITLSLLCISTTAYAQGNNAWTSKANMLTGKVGLESVELGGSIYAIGGNYGGNSVQKYNIATNSWTTVSTAPVSFGNPIVVAINNKIYIIDSNSSSVYVYDPNANTWTQKTSGTSHVSGAAGAAIDGKIYVVGGLNLNRVDCYDTATDTWSVKASISQPRWYLGVTASNGKLYAIGGNINTPNIYCGNVECYDPTTNTWSSKTGKPTASSNVSVAAIGNKIYAFGGWNDILIPTGVMSNVEVYDIAANSWTTVASMPTARSEMGTAVYNNRLYAMGGWEYSNGYIYSTKLEVYSPILDLKGYWTTFSGTSVTDQSGNGNTGTLIGGSSTTGYLTLTGSNYVSVPSSSTLNVGTGDFSISCSFQTTNTATYNTIIDKRDANTGYHLILYNGLILLQMTNSTTWFNYWSSNTPTFNDGAWHHLVVSVDRDSTTGLKFYVDGILILTMNPMGVKGDLTNTAPLLIGRHRDASGNFIGNLDDIRIYKDALSSEDTGI